MVRPAEAVQSQQERRVPSRGRRARVDPVQERAVVDVRGDPQDGDDQRARLAVTRPGDGELGFHPGQVS